LHFLVKIAEKKYTISGKMCLLVYSTQTCFLFLNNFHSGVNKIMGSDVHGIYTCVQGYWNCASCIAYLMPDVVYPLYISQFKCLGNYVQQNSLNLTGMELDRCWIIEYSGLSGGTCIDVSFTGNHLLLPLNLCCATNQRSISLGYLLHLLVRSHQGTLLCFMESSQLKNLVE